MINLKHLELMYQQWIQGNEAYLHRWVDFVELVAKETNVAQDVIVRELEKTYWFKKSND
jgi:hypothetical protein